MAVAGIKEVLLWCAGLNHAVLLLWFGMFVLAHDWMYRMHSRRFRLPVATFDTVHYAGMATCKIGILLSSPASRSSCRPERTDGTTCSHTGYGGNHAGFKSSWPPKLLASQMRTPASGYRAGSRLLWAGSPAATR